MTIDTKALRGLIERLPDDFGISLSVGKSWEEVEAKQEFVRLLPTALPDLLTAYEERDRLRNEMEQVADSIGPMARLLEDNPIMAGGVAKALRLIEKSAYKELEPKQ